MVRFFKYHGCGNNFILMHENNVQGFDLSALAKDVCNAATGVGADGLIIVKEKPELEMVFYNMDGSRAEMCGNGIRCFAAYCYDEQIRTEKQYIVKTLAGYRMVDRLRDDPFLVRINMGKPSFKPSDFGVEDDSDFFLKRVLHTSEGDFTVSSCLMGVPHTVVWVDEFPTEATAAQLSNHEVFTQNTNVNFAKVSDRITVELKTYERGVGFTCACGTGACATLVIGMKENKLEDMITVRLPYGRLLIEQSEKGNVFMTGPAIKSAEGKYCWQEGKV